MNQQKEPQSQSDSKKQSSNRSIIWVLIVVVLVALGAVLLWPKDKDSVNNAEDTATVYSTDKIFTGNHTIPTGKRVVLKDGATLTIDGNFILAGQLECEDGPLNLTVNGGLEVTGALYCDRGETVADGDLSHGINIVATKGAVFGDDSALVTNGHVQLVDDAANLATTQEAIDELFADAAADSGAEEEGFRMGPFIPVESLDDITYVPADADSTTGQILLPQENKVTFLEKVRGTMISEAQAKVQATDATGAAVPDTVKIGGKWVVGNPNAAPPKNLKIPTPPKNIKKIILNFNFGKNNSMTLANWTLTGPDGLIGATVTGSCDVTGGPGNDAMRLNAKAANITINNFTLNLGNGGEGGLGETSKDCDPGNAKGGEGGKAGNFKMIASNNFQITGAFNVTPGKGGIGGKAIAHGKTGELGCPGTKGGDAISRGGVGGDNKKGLKIIGTVAGTSNINIGKLVGGKGGSATSNGGIGGAGNACDCDGGLGGNTQTTGGNGGDAISKKFTSIGGDAGDTSDNPGIGGNGFDCDATGPGGDGGVGGNVQTAEQGKPGTGSTSNGQSGTSLNATGGDGGNGGDGCNEGAGGAGGKGNPDGEKGDDGVNLCLDVNTNTGVSLTNTTALMIGFDTELVEFDCTQGTTDTIIERINLDVPDGHSWEVDESTVPPGLQINPPSGTFETELVQMSLQCTDPIVVNTAGGQQQWSVQVNLHDNQGDFVSGDSFFDVFYEVNVGGAGNDTVLVSPSSLSFTYDHTNPQCPLRIGELDINVPPGATWSINPNSGSQAIWVAFPNGNSGQGPGSAPVEFPCLLDSYENQSLNTTLRVDVTSGDGNDTIIGSSTVDVDGTFEGF